MKLSIGKIILTAVLVSAPAIFLAQSYWSELGSKAEYSSLQIIEERERGTKINQVAFRHLGKYKIVGLRASGQDRNVWILLNVKHPPYYKQVPVLNFTISKTVLDQIRNSGSVSDTVVAVLETHLDKY